MGVREGVNIDEEMRGLGVGDSDFQGTLNVICARFLK